MIAFVILSVPVILSAAKDLCATAVSAAPVGVSAFQCFGVSAVPSVPPCLSASVPDSFILDAALFAVVLIAFTFSVAWFADQAKGLTGAVSCRCGKRQVVGIAPQAHPDFVRLLSANCPACQSAPPSEPGAQATGGCATAVSAVLPLPEGEGRGEGIPSVPSCLRACFLHRRSR